MNEQLINILIEMKKCEVDNKEWKLIPVFGMEDVFNVEYIDENEVHIIVASYVTNEIGTLLCFINNNFNEIIKILETKKGS